MTVHVGFYPNQGKYSCYNEASKSLTNYEIYNVKNVSVFSMFKEINSKVDGTPGHVCVSLSLSYDHEFREKFIEEGLEYFEYVEIINPHTAIYLNAVSQTNYKPINDDVVWVKAENYIYVWRIKGPKAQFIFRGIADTSKLKELQRFVMLSKLNKGPDVMLYQDDMDITNVKEVSTVCRFFTYSDFNGDSQGSLMKARISAGDPSVVHFDAENFLFRSMKLASKEKEILYFSYGQHLPVSLSQKIILQDDSDFLQVDEKKIPVTVFYKEIDLTFEINENEIYSVIINNYKWKDKYNFIDRIYENDSTKKSVIEENNILFRYYYNIPSITIPLNMSVIGIDLGTSRCCAALSRRNGIATVPLDNTGDRLLPSYVAYDEENVKCGKIAVNRLRYHSKSTIFDSKRIIGRKFNDIEIDSIWNFIVNGENDQVYLEVNGFNNEKRKLAPEEVAADLLRHIKQKAEEYQGTKFTKVVITVPVAFTELQKAATIKAAEMAGWDEVELLPEPIAAAFAYLVDQSFTNDFRIFLFDFGGGTLDVCIFRTDKFNQIQISSQAGDSKLGGRNFDILLINYFNNLLNTDHGIVLTKEKKYKLMKECQRIKEDLSDVDSSSLDIDDFDSNKQGIISINREEFQSMAQSLLNKVKNTIQSALFEANCEPHQINKVLQVGGGSRMPMIKNLLKEIFPDAEQCCEEHPDEVVAIGAAYYAYSILSE